MRLIGFEPTTSTLGGWHSIQLSYRRIKMRRTGFEPAQALSHKSLNLARLTTPAPPLKNKRNLGYKKFYKQKESLIFGDGHNRLETPVPFPNTEVKLPMLMGVVSEKKPNH